MQLDEIALPPDIRWADRFGGFSSVEESVAWSATGAQIVQRATRKNGAGRPVTLECREPWRLPTLAEVTAIEALLPRASMTLILHDGTALTVGWRYKDGPIVAQPHSLQEANYQYSTDFHSLTLRLRTL